MKKIFLSLAVIVAAGGSTYAQSFAPDALKFSQSNYGSTARFKGMAGAQIGVGGDMSSLGANPAGLGLFTQSEFSLTPEFNSMSGSARFLDNTTTSSKSRLNLNNLGVVIYSPTYKAQGQDIQKGLISSVFGFGYARNNDFGGNFSYSGVNGANSIADSFAEQANRYNVTSPTQLPGDSFASGAYEGYLIGDYTDPQGLYFLGEADVNNSQSKSEIRSGSTSELTAAGAINISNQLYIGGSVGLVSVRYVNDSRFSESGFSSTENSDYSILMTQNQETTGSGVNGRLGLIFRPVSNFRLGATFQTPTWLIIEDYTTIDLASRLATGVNAGNTSTRPDPYLFRYKLRTPYKGSLGASYVIGGRALISADIDYTDYSSIRFSNDVNSNDPDRITDENNNVRDNYKEAVNYRIGAEYKVDDAFSLRGGYGLNGSAINIENSSYFATKIYTGGLGYRVNNYYFDVAYQHLNTNTDLAPYELGTAEDPQEPVANIKTSRNNVFLTFGVRF